MQWTLVVEFSEEFLPQSTFQHFIPGNETIKTPATDKAATARMGFLRSHLSKLRLPWGTRGTQGFLTSGVFGFTTLTLHPGSLYEIIA